MGLRWLIVLVLDRRGTCWFEFPGEDRQFNLSYERMLFFFGRSCSCVCVRSWCVRAGVGVGGSRGREFVAPIAIGCVELLFLPSFLPRRLIIPRAPDSLPLHREKERARAQVLFNWLHHSLARSLAVYHTQVVRAHDCVAC